MSRLPNMQLDTTPDVNDAYARRLSAPNVTLQELLRDIDTALLDWMRQYAPDEFETYRCEESAIRIRDHGGTLAYIAALRMKIKSESDAIAITRG